VSTVVSAQFRSARHALRWSVQRLADESGVSVRTIKRIEAEDGVPSSNKPNVEALKSAFEAAGIEFIGEPDDGPGIRVHARASHDAEGH